MKHRKSILLLAALLALSACQSQEPQDALRLWFPSNPDASDHTAQAVTFELSLESETNTSEAIEVLIEALFSGPKSENLVNPFPEGTKLLSWRLHDNQLDLELSEEYGSLTGVDLTLADYCLTLTLCQLDGIDRVSLSVDGAAGQEKRLLTPEEVIFTGAEEEPRQINTALYFPRALGKGLGFETRELTLTEDDDLYMMIAGELMNGPTDPDLQTFLPDADVLMGVWMDDNVCYVNFSSEFLTQAPEGETEQNLLLYSVVDTLGNLDSVTAVQLLVEGERLPEFGGVETNLPLEPDFGLLSGKSI